MYGRRSDPVMTCYRHRVAPALRSIPSQKAIGQRDWGFLTVRGGFDPEDHRFRPQVVGVVKVWKDL